MSLFDEFYGKLFKLHAEPEVHLDSVIHRKLFAKSYLVVSICFNLETSQWNVIISEVAFFNMKILLQLDGK